MAAVLSLVPVNEIRIGLFGPVLWSTIYLSREDGCGHRHRFAREPQGHAAISWSSTPLCGNWRSLCLDFGWVCYQRSDPAFSLGHWFVLSDFLCPQCDDQLRRSLDVRHYDRGRRSYMGSPCICRN